MKHTFEIVLMCRSADWRLWEREVQLDLYYQQIVDYRFLCFFLRHTSERV